MVAAILRITRVASSRTIYIQGLTTATIIASHNARQLAIFSLEQSTLRSAGVASIDQRQSIPMRIAILPALATSMRFVVAMASTVVALSFHSLAISRDGMGIEQTRQVRTSILVLWDTPALAVILKVPILAH